MLGYAAEFYGETVEAMNLGRRITVASMATEMAGIVALFPPNEDVVAACRSAGGDEFESVYADEDAVYDKTVEIDIGDLEPMVSLPGHPEDVVTVAEVGGTKIDSVFIGSCTNGRYDDLSAAAEILKNKKVAPGIVLKIVPSTRKIWERCLKDGIIDVFMKAGALVGSPGCAGCAAGQIGQNGPGEVTISTGNRNYPGKQGKGDVYLASPATAAASAVAGVIVTPESIPEKPVVFPIPKQTTTPAASRASVQEQEKQKPLKIKGRVWLVREDNIDTDMIFHNRYLTITDIEEMAQYTFDNLKGWEDFAQKARPGDIVVTGSNFGAGSSRQQAVDCFKSLGIRAIVARSFGAIYERNAINAGLPVVVSNLMDSGIESGEEITIDLKSGEILRRKTNEKFSATPFAKIQKEIYQRGGLFKTQ
jgi:3-isopropylmalate dehydratase small subunit